MLVLDNLTLAFGDKTVFDELSFELEQGQIACLLGQSGCGKTSVLRCICGFETPKSGSIMLSNKPLFDTKTNIAAHERGIGMVFQDYALFGHLSVADNIGFGLHGQDKASRQARVNELLELIGLSEYGNRYVHELSGGQQQRVALARALAPRPSLILLDEPFSNLDVDLRAQLSKEIRKLLKAQQVSAILVTHDQAEAFAFSDKIGVMADGKLQQWDTPTQLYHYPKTPMVAEFVGDGVLMAIDGRDDNYLVCAVGQIPYANITNAQETLDTASHVLVRPHDVYVCDNKDKQGIAVTVSDKDFLGGYWLYTLMTPQGQKLLMQTAMTVNGTDFDIHDNLCVYIKQACVL